MYQNPCLQSVYSRKIIYVQIILLLLGRTNEGFLDNLSVESANGFIVAKTYKIDIVYITMTRGQIAGLPQRNYRIHVCPEIETPPNIS